MVTSFDEFYQWLAADWKYPAFIAGVAVTAAIAHALFSRRRHRRLSFPYNVVILHQFPRAKYAPNLSPYPIKLETYLRIACIPYKNSFATPLGPKGKCPWISLNHDDVADSSFCIEYLNKKFDVDLNSHLTEEQKAVAYAFQVMVDEYLYWCGVLFRWVYKDTSRNLGSLGTFRFPLGIPFWVMKPLIAHYLNKAAYYQGVGRHSREEVEMITEKILQKVSTYLGNKPYLMGEKPSEVDCSIFGFLVQAVWNMPGSKMEILVNEKYVNLKEYTIRIKEKYWSDWDSCLEQS